MSGKSFGDYLLARVLSSGGMAEVYLAINESNSQIPRRLALKKILPVYENVEAFKKLFEYEGVLGQTLDHPNIVRVFDRGEVDGEHFLVMEYIDGPDLEKILRASRKRGKLLPIQLVLYLATEIAEALDYAHRATDAKGDSLRIVHGDISPSNILLGSDGSVKLTDFGVARSTLRVSETKSGEVHGRYSCMSPEQLEGHPVDRTSDIFSLGTLLYHLTTGRNPFERGGELQTMEAVVAGDFEDPSLHRDGLPPGLKKIIQRCLAVRPEDRPGRADAVRQILSQLGGPGAREGGPRKLVDYLAQLFPHQMSRRTTATPSEEAVTQTLSEANPALQTMELGQWSTDSAEHMALTTAEFKFSADDPRRVRLMGRNDEAPPEAPAGTSPILLSSEHQLGDSLPPPKDGAPAQGTSAQVPGLEGDPFQLGSVIEDGEPLSLPGQTNYPRESATPSVPIAPSGTGSRSMPTLSMDDLKVAATGPLVTPSRSSDALAAMEAAAEAEAQKPPRLSLLWMLPVAAGLFAFSLLIVIGGPSSTILSADPVVSDLEGAASDSATLGPGILIISSQPWAYVSVDGVMREWVTPTRLELEPGPHTIGLFHPETGWKIEREVEVKAGEELTLNVSR